MRQRDLGFCEVLIAGAARVGSVTEDVLVDAVQANFSTPRRMLDPEKIRRRALVKARGKLRQSNIRERIAEVYADRGFDLVDAMDLHVQHIKGEITKQVVTEDGTVVEVKLAPNYAALKDFLAMTLPKTPTQVQVKSTNLNVHGKVEDFNRSEAPVMLPRVIGKAVVHDDEK